MRIGAWISITYIKSQAQLGTFEIPKVARWKMEMGAPWKLEGYVMTKSS